MKHTVLLLISLCLLLAACQSAESSPTAAASATTTRTPAPTQTATITPTPLPPPRTPTPTYRPTSTFTSTPTQTPYIPPSPLPPAPLPDPSVQYVLSTPDAEQMLVVATMLNQKWSQLYWLDQTDPFDPLIEYFPSESYGVRDFIEDDLWSYYPTGYTGANIEDIVHARELQWGTGVSGWLTNYLIGWAVQNLNQEQIVLQAEQSIEANGATYLPHPIELDSDPEPEWVVDVHIVRQGSSAHTFDLLRTWLLLNGNPNGSYTALPNDILTTFDAGTDIYDEVLFDMSHDINGDGIPDLVVSYMSYLAGGVHGGFQIYIWDGSKLAYVGRGDLPGVNPRFGETNQSTYEINDFDGDGRDEIRVTWPRFGEFGCRWQTITTYDWNGQKLVETVKNKDVPVESGEVGCYITQALRSEKPEDKTHWFEMAYWLLPRDTSSDMEAWVLLRLMAAYYGQGRDQEAEQVVQQLVNLTGEGNFVLAVKEAIASTDASPLEVCHAMYERALQSGNDSFDSDIDGYLMSSGVYPISGEPDPFKVCPYFNLPYDRLLTQHVPDTITPPEGYAAAGFELQLAQAINIDLDPKDEWLAIYQKDLYLFNAVSGKWQADRLYNPYYQYPMHTVQSGVADVTGDQVPDLLLMVARTEPHDRAYTSGPDPVPCQAGAVNYMFIVADLTKTDYPRLDWRDVTCWSEPLPDLTTIEGITEFRYLFFMAPDSSADWPQWQLMFGMPGRPDTYQNIYGYIDEIEGNILAGTDLEASRQALQALIAYIPPADPEAAFIVPRLQYLLGLSYEIEGRSQEAVDAYLALIQSAPQSAWSWLAWTRLAAP